ncbi:MAG: DUF6569 family protein [Burkholderiales bacterium]
MTRHPIPTPQPRRAPPTPPGGVAPSPIAARLADCRFGAPLAHRTLVMLPVLADDERQEAPYLLLDDAMAAGRVAVTEVGAGGSVPELALANLAGLPVLLLDGEELVGAKQNRILNLTVLAPPLAVTKIPVSCVEAGRWSSVSARFASGGRTHFASGRARKAADVTASMRREGHRRGDQGAVWQGIAEKSARMGVRSATGAAAALYEDRHEALERFVGAIPAQPDQCGAVFVIDGRVAGLDLFDHPRTFAKALPKLLRGYALDALDAQQTAAHGRQDADRTALPSEAGRPAPGPDGLGAVHVEVLRFLGRIARAAASSHAAVGQGQDWRLADGGVAGGALVADGRVVHLCAFPVAEAARGMDPAEDRVRM